MNSKNTNISITFLGTGQHRDTHRSALFSSFEQISQQAQQPDSSVAAWLIDGPGCKGSLEHPMPGTYYYKDGKKIPDPVLAAKENATFWDNFRKIYHAITGEGVESSILEATNYLQEIIVNNGGEIPSQLNLQGFSRGADSCVRLANVIYLLYPEIKINLFLVDPVPGPFRRDDPESYHIPPNVDSCHITLMLNEHKKFFQPQHKGRYIFTNPQTRAAFHYMPGRHGAGLSTVRHKDITPPVTQCLVQDSLLQFNIANKVLPRGTKLANWHETVGEHNVQLPLSQPLEALTSKIRFEHLCFAMSTYKQLAGRHKAKFYSKRRLYKERNRHVLDADLFIDSEHRSLFKIEFPAVFNWFFEKNFPLNGGEQSYSKQDVFQELNKLNADPITHFYRHLLTKFNITSLNSLDDIPQPQGIARCEITDFDAPMVRCEWSYLQYCLKNIVSEYHYRVPRTWFGNWLPGHDSVLTKSVPSDQIKKQIETALLAAENESSEKKAKDILKKIILQIQSNPNEEFFFQQIKKIIPDSGQYINSVLSILKRYEPLLPPAHATVLAKAINLIQKQIDHPLKDDYQKRLNVQEYILSLNTAMRRLNRHSNKKNILCERLFLNLNQLSNPSYAEPKVLDTVIASFESYRQRHRFLSYFPGSQILGFYNPENIVMVSQLLRELHQIKNSKTDYVNLTQVESALKKACLKYAKTNSDAENETKLFFWKKNTQFKADPLSKLIETHLLKMTQLSNLIFTIPTAPNHAVERRPNFLRK